MNNRYSFSVRIILLAALAHAFLIADGWASGEEQAGSAAKIEAAWTSGLTSSNLAVTSTLVEDILSEDDSDRFRGAELLERLMEVKSPLGDDGDEDLVVLEGLVLHLLAADSLSPTAAQRNSMLVSRYLGRLRDEIIPGFSRTPVSANIGPPPGVPGFAGMSPEAISDPRVRAEYERALQANVLNAKINRRQHTLGKIERSIVGRSVDYLSTLTRNGKIDHTHLDRCMTDAKFGSDEKLRVLNRLRQDAE